MSRYVSFFVVSFFFVAAATAQQNSDFGYSRPLKDVLIDIEQRFDVSFRYPDSLVEGRILEYADWRIRPGFEPTMVNVLAPFDLIFKPDSKEGYYKIKPYEYHRRSVEEGKQFLAYLKTLYHNKEEWELRRDSLKRCFLTALKLEKLPDWSASGIYYSNRRRYKDYEIVNVALETLPGVYVCGSLYQPKKMTGKVPVIISPNGHFSEGRYNKDMQIRYAMLARMGAIVMSYDMFAWGESELQFNHSNHHKSLAQTIQIMNGERVLDFLLSQNHADTNRVGITGGSGGGSQTMLLSAIDDRIDVSVPVVMLSSYFYGGCPCESGQPVHLCGGGTNNVEMASMMAPKPLLVISDGGDWTAHVPEVEFPFLQYVYSFYSKTQNVENVHIPNEGHSYGKSKRYPMYAFMAKWLGLKSIVSIDGTWDESGCVVEDASQMYVFDNDSAKLPENAIMSFKALEELVKKL
ncbi:alpha/beta hydrolase family protein [Geofilum sp. OHC36d9]|uniref:alpha/beta hydrolase family protein n=1 Tax=Geofilum sp. OHC36d9 TaxID=3458413 RepID=UPI0040349D6D